MDVKKMNVAKNLAIVLLIIALAASILLTIRDYRDYNWFERLGVPVVVGLPFTAGQMLLGLIVTILVTLMSLISLLSFLNRKPYSATLLLVLIAMTLIMIIANPSGNKWTGNIFLDMHGLSSRTIAIIIGVFIFSGSLLALITPKTNKKNKI